MWPSPSPQLRKTANAESITGNSSQMIIAFARLAISLTSSN
jgi:hypothetical protein